MKSFPKRLRFWQYSYVVSVEAPRRQRMDLRAAEPHLSPRVYSCLSDIPFDRVVEAYRRMTDISKINQWAVEFTECRSQLALFLIYLKQSYTVS